MKLDKLTRHHIIPRSRGGSNLEDNIAFVNRVEHNDYHRLFENKKPDEIIDYLNETFWDNKYDIEMNRREYGR